MEKEGGNRERMRKCRESIFLHFLIFSPFPPHFLILSPFPRNQDARMPQFVQPWYKQNKIGRCSSINSVHEENSLPQRNRNESFFGMKTRSCKSQPWQGGDRRDLDRGAAEWSSWDWRGAHWVPDWGSGLEKCDQSCSGPSHDSCRGRVGWRYRWGQWGMSPLCCQSSLLEKIKDCWDARKEKTCRRTKCWNKATTDSNQLRRARM